MADDEGEQRAPKANGSQGQSNGPWASLAESTGIERFKQASDRLSATVEPVREMTRNWSIAENTEIDFSEIEIPENPTYATNELLERMIEAGRIAEGRARDERIRAHKARVLNGWLTGISALGAVLAALFAGIALWG